MLFNLPLLCSTFSLLVNKIGAGPSPGGFDNVSSPTTLGTPTFQIPFPSNGSIGGIFACQDIDWVNCTYTVQPLNTCIAMTDPWNNSISSIGPDNGTVVIAYNGTHCDGNETSLVFPGSDNLDKIGWNDHISSIKAFAI